MPTAADAYKTVKEESFNMDDWGDSDVEDDFGGSDSDFEDEDMEVDNASGSEMEEDEDD